MLAASHAAAEAGRSNDAIARLESAEKSIQEVCAARVRLFEELREVWERSRFPSPQMDVFRRERALGLEKWAADLRDIRLEYAARHQVP